MKFVVHTQFLENYGAHAESGKFADGMAYWKFKSGETYIVEGLDRIQDAVAFVMAAFSDNSIHGKEFPCHWETLEEWFSGELSEIDSDYKEFKLECARVVNPAWGKETMKYIGEEPYI